jgi:uncharacterized protein YggE
VQYAFLLLIALPSAALAQSAAVIENTIQVSGTGKVTTPPNLAFVQYSLAGEGKTPDEASLALVTVRRSIVDQVGSILGGDATPTDSDLVIMPVRGPRCENASGYNAQPRLSQGDCAIIGYLATSGGTIKTSQIAKAGTAVGLASRLGARDARISSFEVEDTRAAQRAALADAVADAGRQAAAIAAAAGRRLGAILSIRDQNSGYRDIVVTGSRIPATHAPPPPPPPPPVEISLSPRPIETVSRVDVTYALLP